MAARLRRELQTDIRTVRGGYGQFRVLLDGKTIVDGGPLAALGILPAPKKVAAAVRDAIGPGLS